MSNQNIQFRFEPEEKLSPPVHHKKQKRTGIFFKVLAFSILSISGITGFFYKKSSEPVKRDYTSILSEKNSSYSLGLTPFFVLMKVQKNQTQLTKVELILELSNPNSITEISESILKIQNQLIFILSNEDISSLQNDDRKLKLKQQLIEQLNLFLVSGIILDIQIKNTFL